MKSILAMPIFNSSTLVGGHRGLQREVTTVNIMDSPDITNWVRPNQFLLTTAYHFKDHPDELVSFLKQLNDQNCSGVGIKTKRYIEELPNELIQLANSLDFPLIELPSTILLGDVLNQVMTEIHIEDKFELKQIFAVQQQTSNILLDGGSLSDIAQTLASFIHKPVLFLNTYCDALGASDNQFLLRTDLTNDLYIKLHTIKLREKELSILPAADGTSAIGVYPLYIGGVIKGYIVLVDVSEADLIPNLLLEQAGKVISFEVMRQEALLEGDKRLRKQFIENLLENNLSREEIIQWGKSFGIQADEKYLLCVCSLDPSLYASFKTESWEEQFRSQIDRFLTNHDIPQICEIKDHHIVFLIHIKSTQTYEPTNLLKELQAHLTILNGGSTFSIGISNLIEDLEKVSQSYTEAKQALRNGYAQHNKEFIYTFRTQQVQELLKSIPNDKLFDFYTSSLGEFAFAENHHHLELLETLSVYLDHHCSIAETAKRLYLHRNTVLNRLNRCEEILKISMKDPDDLLKIKIALVIHQMNLNNSLNTFTTS